MNTNKGIYCIKTNGRVVRISASDNLQKDKEAFDDGVLFTGRLENLIKRARNASFEILKYTDNPEVDVWLYLLPQLSRVEYKFNLIVALNNRKTHKRNVERAVDWFCETFSSEYCAEIEYTLDNYIMVKVIKDLKTFEIYGFKGRQQPEYRIILQEE